MVFSGYGTAVPARAYSPSILEGVPSGGVVILKQVKRLLKKYKYPPEEAEHALDIVLKQCEEWSDGENYDVVEAKVAQLYPQREVEWSMAAEDKTPYNAEKTMQD